QFHRRSLPCALWWRRSVSSQGSSSTADSSGGCRARFRNLPNSCGQTNNRSSAVSRSRGKNPPEILSRRVAALSSKLLETRLHAACRAAASSRRFATLSSHVLLADHHRPPDRFQLLHALCMVSAPHSQVPERTNDFSG